MRTPDAYPSVLAEEALESRVQANQDSGWASLHTRLQPSAHLLVAHGPLREKERLDFQIGGRGETEVPLKPLLMRAGYPLAAADPVGDGRAVDAKRLRERTLATVTQGSYQARDVFLEHIDASFGQQIDVDKIFGGDARPPCDALS